ncbi:MAG: hypothetical protein Kow006_28900 [Gammaproteobacteria bacterium]
MPVTTKGLLAALSVFLLPWSAFPAPLSLSCQNDGHLYRWRDADGRLNLSDCPPATASEVKKIPRSSLKPTLIQPPPPVKRNTRPAGSRKKRQPARRKRKPTLTAEQLRRLSPKCRWLVGKIQHLKELVAENERQGRGRSIWAPELSKRRRELRAARCGVRI